MLYNCFSLLGPKSSGVFSLLRDPVTTVLTRSSRPFCAPLRNDRLISPRLSTSRDLMGSVELVVFTPFLQPTRNSYTVDTKS